MAGWGLDGSSRWLRVQAVLLVGCWAAFAGKLADKSRASNYTRVLARLLDEDRYDPSVSPMVQGEPLQVGVGMKLRRIAVDIHEAKMSVTGFMRMSWLDDRLFYNGSEEVTPNWSPQADFLASAFFDGARQVIWVPDIQCANCDEQRVDNQGVYIYDEDHAEAPAQQYPYNVFSGRPVKLQSPCYWPLMDFPFDSPTCNLTFWSWMYNGEQLNVTLMNDPIAWDRGHIGSAEYEFVNASCEHILEQYQFVGKEVPWPKVTIVIQMRRKTETYVINIIIPLACIVLLGNCVFVLPLREGRAGSGERLGYAITLFLTIIAICLFTSGLRPLLSYSVWLDRYQVRCVILTMIPVAETVVLFYLTNVTEDAKHYVQKNNPDLYKHGDRVRVRNFSFEPWREGTVHRCPDKSPTSRESSDAEQKTNVLVQADDDDEPRVWHHCELVRRNRVSEKQEAAVHIAESDFHRDSNVYDEFLVWHRILKGLDRLMHKCGFETSFSKQLSWRAVDQVFRHLYPILCYFALHQLYSDINPAFKVTGHESLEIFGGYSLVQEENVSSRLWNGSAFVLEGLWFVYSAGHLVCWFLLNLLETFLLRRSREKVRKQKQGRMECDDVEGGGQQSDVVEGSDVMPELFQEPRQVGTEPEIDTQPL